MQSPIEKLKIEIQSHIDRCDRSITPKLCDFRSTKDGRQKLEDLIIERVVRKGQTIAEAMLQIEREFNHNMID